VNEDEWGSGNAGLFPKKSHAVEGTR